ncbi:hypothetical protein ACIBO2_11795 [Nonomuraea sp. NPDC050022]|uniref:hypothetical protein n=1 Tax=Nonomuraea sp. NPDC050022 TaxID=3364358 RepID=UPI00378F2638
MTGQPAANLPLHWTADGLTIGVMLAGRLGAERTLISLSAQVGAARGGFWGDRRSGGPGTLSLLVCGLLSLSLA